MSTTNTYSNDKWQLIFSNIPSTDGTGRSKDTKIFNNFVKRIAMPSLSMEITRTEFNGGSLISPVTKYNADLQNFNIDFIADEDNENYFALFDWAMFLKKGCITEFGVTDSSDVNINEILVRLKDNEGRVTKTVGFKECYLVDLSPYSLEYGTSEEQVFTATFAYNEIDITSTTETLNN